MRTAFCYVTDGHDDAEMRKWSVASLRRYCGDSVDVYTVAPSGMYAGTFPGERVISIDDAFGDVFGDVSPTRWCRGSSFPTIVFGKFILPVIRELELYDRIITLEADIEIVSSAFSGLCELEMPECCDVGLVRRSGTSTSCSLAQRHPDLTVRGLPYYSVGLVMLRGGIPPRHYVDRVREMLRVSESRGFPFPEEHAANMFLSIFPIPEHYHVIPHIQGVHSGGVTDIRNACALHYGGPRKNFVRDRWRRQYETGGTIDLSDITR